MKYLNQLTTEDIKEISKLCVAKVYHKHYEPIGTFGPKSMLVVLEDSSEFYICDFCLQHGYNNEPNNNEYIKYMCCKFGKEYINDYANSLYDSEIEELEKKISDLKTKKQTTLSELKQYSMPKDRYQQILEKQGNYYLLSAGIKRLVSEDDESPAKIAARLLNQYNNCKDTEKRELIDSLVEVFTDRKFLQFFTLAMEHSDVNKDLNTEELEQLYFSFTELLEERDNNELATELLELLSNSNTDSIDVFLINICGYSIKTILDYMENKNDQLIIKIKRF